MRKTAALSAALPSRSAPLSRFKASICTAVWSSTCAGWPKLRVTKAASVQKIRTILTTHHLRLLSEQLDQSGLFLWSFKEVHRADVTITLFLRCLRVLNDFHEKGRGLLAAQAPDDIAASGRIPLVAHFVQPCIHHAVVLGGGADAERFEILAIFTVMFLGKAGP